ncbi:cAMP-binding domain of CRP or a regulatory subunit of cAMP-dependent protein kinases [Chryseobacterium oleae]|uniref:cAMP-binding domain of CRP or a regulatory subunit of cAMP-dependent protein kinases n=1 Tax=Chryseobacterium oleae TaxID=491207 RepID=A0A1I4YTY8_CHROL|nr:Crp/Fnr family transcriptional regulator [Chryseobacterium oleae]SFN41417.1 cAMP-binding domain of CRP or a regulatory subunit of cAMP-dependent protein kinases [Chryseobacterium oleae]
MVINEKFLFSAGAEVKQYRPGDTIFHDGATPYFYYQIIKGKVKLNNYNKEGKELIQKIVTDGESLGESLLFIGKPYPMDAVALEPCSIIKLCRNNFFSMLNVYPQLYFDLCKGLSDCLYYQYIMLQANSSQNPSERIMGVLEYLKTSKKDHAPFSYKIPFTRQQLASLTGLCVETAIRTIKNMEKRKLVMIKDRKIYF